MMKLNIEVWPYFMEKNVLHREKSFGSFYLINREKKKELT